MKIKPANVGIRFNDDRKKYLGKSCKRSKISFAKVYNSTRHVF